MSQLLKSHGYNKQHFTVLEVLSDVEILMKLFTYILLCRWPSLLKYYSHTDSVSWLEEYKARHNAGLEARRIVASFSKRFFSEHVSRLLYVCATSSLATCSVLFY